MIPKSGSAVILTKNQRADILRAEPFRRPAERIREGVPALPQHVILVHVVHGERFGLAVGDVQPEPVRLGDVDGRDGRVVRGQEVVGLREVVVGDMQEAVAPFLDPVVVVEACVTLGEFGDGLVADEDAEACGDVHAVHGDSFPLCVVDDSTISLCRDGSKPVRYAWC